MPKKRKADWVIEAHGIRIRLFRRGGTIYRDVTLGRGESSRGKARTLHDIKSLGHNDPARAEVEMHKLAAALKTAELVPDSVESPLTLADLAAAYRQHRGPLLSPDRLRTVNTALALFTRHLGGAFRIADMDQHRIDTYVRARQTGKLRPDDFRARNKVAPDTIRNEIAALSAVCNWAGNFRVDGKLLLPRNPVRGLVAPKETNRRRPVARPERYQQLAAVAATVDPSGQFGLMLAVAWSTGRRINAICHLTAADVLLEPDTLLAAFAEAGQDDEIARAWPGGLRWRAEWDKKGFETFSPLPTALRPVLSAYMRDKQIIGRGWLFATPAGDAVNKARADYLLRKAEAAAGLARMNRGGWHAFRRGWATLRKSLPVQDVMLAGGWRDSEALRAAYQQADSATVLSVVNIA